MLLRNLANKYNIVSPSVFLNVLTDKTFLFIPAIPFAKDFLFLPSLIVTLLIYYISLVGYFTKKVCLNVISKLNLLYSALHGMQ